MRVDQDGFAGDLRDLRIGDFVGLGEGWDGGEKNKCGDAGEVGQGGYLSF